MNSRFKQIRKEAKLSQIDFAKRLDVSQNYIYLLEAGKNPVTDKMVKEVCREFHVDENWLRTGEGDMYAPATREIEIAEITASLLRMNADSERYKFITSLNDVLIKMNEEQMKVLLDSLKKIYSDVFE